MQKDMHYYGTYVMARAAGITQKRAQIIASAAQFVDDNATKKSVNFEDGGALHSRASAHHAMNIKNLDRDDQRFIWVPFHFLPGNEGESFTEKLVCTKNSDLAKEMTRNHREQHKEDFSDELMGVAAHVYADTFSHYGFSGVSSELNRIDNDSFEFDIAKNSSEIIEYVENKQKHFKVKYSEDAGFFETIASWFAEELSGALGHGAACTFPDRPFLVWKFDYDKPVKSSGWRDNPSTFMEACEALHKMFVEYTQAKSGITDMTALDFNSIREKVKNILEFEGTEEERIKKWKDAVTKEAFLGNNQTFPEYLGIDWLTEKGELEGKDSSMKALNTSLYRFYQATSYHRHYVLRDLLPSKKLVVA
ncbi:DUF6765 family protein [Maridesulfovibrio frigidus]|uniref:DUF6765 family protein n=1 Tax=Maridesulfovibrio frigidus TaxID=340956 RepID=UPI0004E12367|nr:DUF6765 family protein [Maridesulfovibrio frigidus]